MAADCCKTNATSSESCPNVLFYSNLLSYNGEIGEYLVRLSLNIVGWGVFFAKDVLSYLFPLGCNRDALCIFRYSSHDSLFCVELE